MKKGTMKDIATSSTTIVFLIISITGVMLYFHLYSGQVKNLHEILGLIFVATALFHVFVNWKSMKNYFSKKIFLSFSVLFTLISATFIAQNFEQKGSPKGFVLQKVINAPLKDSLKVLHIDEQQALTTLKTKGFDITKHQTIQTLAKANHTSPFEIIALVTP